MASTNTHSSHSKIDNRKHNMLKDKIRYYTRLLKMFWYKQSYKTRISTPIVLVLLYLILVKLVSSGNPTFSLDDSTFFNQHYGIVRGGTGNRPYQSDHRVGGLPPVQKQHDPSVYDYGLEQNPLQQLNVVEHTWKKSNRIIIVLGANRNGGVNDWKNPNEWEVERESIFNKKAYAAKHGYELVVKDFTRQKKYSDEFREGWQKFDAIRDTMAHYDHGDWIWYLDLYSLIMEDKVRIEDLVFKQLNKIVYRDLQYYNPKKLELDLPMVDTSEPINLILTQDCNGFNLNSFLIKKTDWSGTLMDLLFEPIIYLNQVSVWRSDEQSALEYYYNNFSWVRSRTAFLPTRVINSLARNSCPSTRSDYHLFYNETSNDFLVNMNGCEINRNCFDEFQFYKGIKRTLHSWFS